MCGARGDRDAGHRDSRRSSLMCGIAGVLHLDGEPASPVVLGKNGESPSPNRGPDGEGQFTDGIFGLAHRRLAIIDLSPAGHQR